MLPVIDFAAFGAGTATQKRHIGALIAAACRETGFFMLANHGLDDKISDAAFAAAHDFFDLTAAEKGEIAIEKSPCHRGWYGPGGEVLDAVKQPQGDMKEGLKIGRDLPDTHILVQQGTPLHGPNQWPRQEGFKDTMMAAYAACETLSRQLMSAFALSLHLPETHFDAYLHLPMATLSPLRYPPHPFETGLGAGAHTDFGCLTLLLQRDIDGLEIQKPDGEWLRVPCDPSLIIVNIGDMMARWTNNLYASTRHRVINRSRHTRHSMAFFFDPDADADLSPLPGCLAEGEDPHYPPASCLEHLLMKIEASFTYRQETPNA